jgi:hypothetical protein
MGNTSLIQSHFMCSTKRGLRNVKRDLAGVAHSCNPSYSGGRNLEDHGLKPAWKNSS